MRGLLQTLIPLDIAKGLALTGRHFFQVFRTANRRKVPFHVTCEYPEVPAKLQPRFRGRLKLILDEAGELNCVCCMACEKICPTGVITIIPTKKEGRKTKLPQLFDFEMERCIFCGFCVESCGFNAILLDQEFELASYRREDFSLGLAGTYQNMTGFIPVAQFSVAEPEVAPDLPPAEPAPESTATSAPEPEK